MAWTTPRTWVANELVTAAFMNTHVRDNLAVLRDSPTIGAALGTTTPASGSYGTPTNYSSIFAGDSISIGTTGITVSTGGHYLILSTLHAAAVTTGDLIQLIQKGGAGRFEAQVKAGTNAAIQTGWTLAFPLTLVAADRIDVGLRQNSGASVQLNNYLFVIRLGA